MKMFKFGFISAILLLISSTFISAQITDPYDEALVGEVFGGWKISCPYITYDENNKLDYIRCPHVKMNKGSYSANTVFPTYSNEETMKYGSPDINLTFQGISKDTQGLEFVDISPKIDKKRVWNFYQIGSGGGGADSNIYGIGITFNCMTYMKEPNPLPGNSENTRVQAFCPEKSYTGKARFRDKKTNAIYTLDLTVDVRYREKPKYIREYINQ